MARVFIRILDFFVPWEGLFEKVMGLQVLDSLLDLGQGDISEEQEQGRPGCGPHFTWGREEEESGRRWENEKKKKEGYSILNLRF